MLIKCFDKRLLLWKTIMLRDLRERRPFDQIKGSSEVGKLPILERCSITITLYNMKIWAV